MFFWILIPIALFNNFPTRKIKKADLSAADQDINCESYFFSQIFNYNKCVSLMVSQRPHDYSIILNAYLLLQWWWVLVFPYQVIALSNLRTYVLGCPIYDTYVYAFLRMYPVLRTTCTYVPCLVLQGKMLGPMSEKITKKYFLGHLKICEMAHPLRYSSK